MERLWSEIGLKIRKKKKKYRRYQGDYVRIRAEKVNDIWSYDIVTWKLFRGGKIRILNVLDECGRKCLGVLVKRNITASDVEGLLAELFIKYGLPFAIPSAVSISPLSYRIGERRAAPKIKYSCGLSV